MAVDHLELSVDVAEIFALVGPNGSGKTTLFRLLSTLIPLQTGEIHILGQHVRAATKAVRANVGVVFQAPSLDRQLTVRENLWHQGRLYGLGASTIRERTDELLDRFGLGNRLHERVDTLSGGLRRRVELAKGLLHEPRLLLLDEPSTGLDPGARADLWHYLSSLRSQQGLTVVLTTHLLEEAERADRLAILDQGRLVALDTPDALRSSVGGDSITIDCDDPEAVAASIHQTFACQAIVLEGGVRMEQPAGHTWIPRLVEALGTQVKSITLGKPTLEDVFIARTGHRFHSHHAATALEAQAGGSRA